MMYAHFATDPARNSETGAAANGGRFAILRRARCGSAVLMRRAGLRGGWPFKPRQWLRTGASDAPHNSLPFAVCNGRSSASQPSLREASTSCSRDLACQQPVAAGTWHTRSSQANGVGVGLRRPCVGARNAFCTHASSMVMDSFRAESDVDARDQSNEGGDWEAAVDLVDELVSLCRGFEVNGDDITILRSPSEFFDALVDGARTAEKRITLAALYVGTGELERNLVNTVAETASRHPGLQVRVLVDHSRGSRLVKGVAEGGQTDDTGSVPPSTTSMLLPLLELDDARVGYLQMPQLQGVRKQNLPARYKEGIAVSHLKAYVFDDTVILSGANLSNDYFTDRQDRYIVFRNCGELADYFSGLVSGLVDDVCWRLDRSGELALPKRADPESLMVPMEAYRQLLEPFCTPNPPADQDGLRGRLKGTLTRTVVFPSIQFAPVDIRQDEQVTSHLLQRFMPRHRLYMASGYFNFPKQYKAMITGNTLLKTHRCHGGPSASSIAILTAAPQANGFWTAKHVAAALPLAYSQLEKRFYQQCKSAGVAGNIKLYEFNKPGWTFHAKGLWLAADTEQPSRPCITMIGSPNFGRRSVERDLEAQVTILTSEESLRDALEEERVGLFEGAELVTDEVWQRPERQLSGWSWESGLWIHVGHRLVAPFL